jgi:hypothetical protein
LTSDVEFNEHLNNLKTAKQDEPVSSTAATAINNPFYASLSFYITFVFEAYTTVLKAPWAPLQGVKKYTKMSSRGSKVLSTCLLGWRPETTTEFTRRLKICFQPFENHKLPPILAQEYTLPWALLALLLPAENTFTLKIFWFIMASTGGILVTNKVEVREERPNLVQLPGTFFGGAPSLREAVPGLGLKAERHSLRQKSTSWCCMKKGPSYLAALFGASTSSSHFSSSSSCYATRAWISRMIFHSWTLNIPVT